jgi:alkylation response protein AidB-like acyl-CoA dehydrogenase
MKGKRSKKAGPPGYFPYPKEWLDPESEEIAKSIRKWADSEMIGKRLEFREDFEHQMKALKILAGDIGLHRLFWPEEMGGVGLSLPGVSSTLVRAYEEIGRADPGIGYISAVNMALAATLVEDENIGEGIKKKVGSVFCKSEDVKLFSLILPGLGDVDVETREIISGREIQAEIRKDGKGWVLSAHGARPVNSGFNAYMYAVIASMPGGMGLAFVKADEAGVERGELLKTTGLSASRNADVSFNNTRLSKNDVTPVDESVYKRLVAWISLLTGAVAVGSMMDVYVIVRDWANNRVIKGKGLLRDNPMDASVLAQVAMDIVEARLLVHDLARAMGNPGAFGISGEDDIFTASGIVSIRVMDNCMHAINRAMEMMGSAGYAKEWHLEKHWRDMKTLQVYLGGRTPVEMDVARYYYGSDVV